MIEKIMLGVISAAHLFFVDNILIINVGSYIAAEL